MKVKVFTIRMNCPEKYIGENKYLTTWEKKMKIAIEKQVDEESSDGLIISSDKDLLDINGYCKKRIDEIEKVYRRKHTLDILEKCGLNTEEFLETKMGKCHRIDMLLGCVQDKIDGFDYDPNGARIPNNKKMNVENMTVSYEGDVLVISDGNYTNKFRFDEHELIYVNGENVFESSLNPIKTKEEERQALVDFHRNMQADRLSHEKKMEKSLEYSGKFWVND